ncbi:MAG: response regulator [Deltaproteobacteria bacterium]|nr:response regulator [Deltaproteobacteria bacterium]
MAFNVLIVDDSSSMRAVIKKVISMSGFKMDQCLFAGHGKEAFKVLADNRVDVILSDINMSEMNGLEFLAEIKKDDLLKKIPVILITTESGEKRMQEAFELGADGFIKKPFLPQEVKERLYEALGVSDEGEYEEEDIEEDDEDLDF